eukprot:8776417-Karenia_brevis.AAC.1
MGSLSCAVELASLDSRFSTSHEVYQGAPSRQPSHLAGNFLKPIYHTVTQSYGLSQPDQSITCTHDPSNLSVSLLSPTGGFGQ